MTILKTRLKGAILGMILGLFLAPLAAFSQSAGLEILQLVNAEKYEEARARLGETPHSDLDALYLEAQIFTRQGRPEEAVRIYRAILAAQPDLIEIRQVLAQTLLAMGDFEAAQFHLQRLLETDRRPGFPEQYAGALRQIERTLPSGVSASVAIVPSSNINRGTTNTYVQPGDPTSGTINDTSKETSGIGLQISASGFLRFPQENGGLVTLTASAIQVLYNNEPDYNIFQPSLSARYEKGSEKGIWFADVFARRTFRRDISQPSGFPGIPPTVSNSTSNSYGFGLSGRRALSGPNILTYSSVIQQTDYETLTNQSGPSATFKLGLQRNLDVATSVNASLVLGRGLPKGDSFKYRSAGVELGLSKNWTGGWATYVGTDYGVRWYDADFGFTGRARNDRYLTLTGSVLNSTFSWNGFSPRVSCSFQTNASNVGFYDFDAAECNVLLTRGF